MSTPTDSSMSPAGTTAPATGPAGATAPAGPATSPASTTTPAGPAADPTKPPAPAQTPAPVSTEALASDLAARRLALAADVDELAARLAPNTLAKAARLKTREKIEELRRTSDVPVVTPVAQLGSHVWNR